MYTDLELQTVKKETAMLASIFILVIFLPAAILPVALDAFVSICDLDEMGISLENTDDIFPLPAHELVGIISVSSQGHVVELNELL